MSHLKKIKQPLYNLLIVEDAESILMAIHDYLLNKFKVYTASTAEAALEIIDSGVEIDLIVTDINLPGISGLDLIKHIRQKKSDTKVIIITSYDINDYIKFIRELKIDQVISKYSNISLHSIAIAAEKMLTKEIFGVRKYFPHINKIFPYKENSIIKLKENNLYVVTVRSSAERTYWIEHIGNLMSKCCEVQESLVKLVLDEISMNALVRAPRNFDGSYKYQQKDVKKDYFIPCKKVDLVPEDYFTLHFGFSGAFIILTCVDPHGTLTKKEVLYRLERQIAIDDATGLPEGLGDLHGRGIFLLREQLTQVVFNIEKTKKTEVLCFLNLQQGVPYKDISVYEIKP